MEAQALKVESRADLKRTRVKKLRTGGNVPAVLYGNSLEPRPLAIAEAEFAKLIKASASQNILVQLKCQWKLIQRRKCYMYNSITLICN